MDPLACLRRIAAAIQSKDYCEAVAALNDYYRWRLRGGYEPSVDVDGSKQAGDAYADSMANTFADALELPDNGYALDSADWQKLVAVRTRLYDERQLPGDERRDLANQMHAVMGHATPF